MTTIPTWPVGDDRLELGAWLEDTRSWTEGHLSAALASADLGPPRHAEAVSYTLLGAGKRLRPALVRLACRELGGDDAAVVEPAVAIEMIHTYSLVHDDLPCMDDDDLRRGRPTCHMKYGEAEAVLVGDGLQALAFQVLSTSTSPHACEMIGVLARDAGCGGMVGGQSLDLAGAEGIGVDAVRRIHRAKTAALIAAATEMGALAAGAGPAERESLAGYGRALGLCFQAVDDILDVVGDQTTLGKTPGKDARAGKATLIDALGLDGARNEAGRHAARALECAKAVGARDDGLLFALVAHFLNRRS